MPTTFRPKLTAAHHARRVGAALAERLRAAGVDAVQWQRKAGQSWQKSGRIRTLVTAMQEGGVRLV